ncbi:MAG: sugar ABC transporter permease [Anaerolineae bacterium]|nr:sugar ABC transporter permease [Anaerolineae bacterium]
MAGGGSGSTLPAGRKATLAAFLQELRATRRATWGNPFGYLFIAPALILYLIFNVWPIIRGFLMAFTDYRFLYPETRWAFNGLANFQEMVNDKDFWFSLGISIRYSLMVIPTVIVLSLFLAVIISRVRHLTAFYRWVVYLPTILPIAVTFLMWKEFYDPRFGFINANLKLLGIHPLPKWLGSTKTALPCIAAADVWRSIGFPTLLFLIGIYNINRELYEAAAIDGANAWQQFWQITIPLLRPTFMLVLVLNSAILGATEQVMIMTGGGPQKATLTIGLYLYNIAFTYGDLRLGYAAAISLVLGLISAGFSAFWFKVLREE